ncbi:unnamed protein product [Rotaria sp. Silwood2]|nr:unnamed protein product [Rotaria sp. Silwood2]
MVNKRSNFVERRLYEYTLHAVCSPLHVIEPGATSDQLAAHVAKLFNVDPEEHEQKYMRALKLEPCSIVLCVDVKKARDLLGEDRNGFSDPYCEVSVINIPSKQDDSNELTSSSSSISASTSPNRPKRSPSLFSCASGSSSKNKLKSLTTKTSRANSKSNSRRYSIDRLSVTLSNKSKTLKSVIYRTEVRPKTINPEWNSHFEFEIENVQEQHLLIRVFDSDCGQVSSFKTVVQEKRGVSRKLRGLRSFIKTGEIKDDFLGEVSFDIKSLAAFGRDQWLPLTGLNQNCSNIDKPRGEILLGLKVHLKLDDKNTKIHQHLLNGTVLEFRRRHSSLSSTNQMNSSIILCPSIFRQNFRPSSMQPRDYSKLSVLLNLILNIEKHSANVYELDTTNLSLWHENAKQQAEAIVDAFLRNEKIPFDPLSKTPIDEPIYEQNTYLACQRIFHMKSQWLDHLKSKQHKRIICAIDPAAYCQKLNNAILSLLNTPDLL